MPVLVTELRTKACERGSRVRLAAVVKGPSAAVGVEQETGVFGVITSFRFRLHPVGPAIVQGVVIYPIEQAHNWPGSSATLSRPRQAKS